MNKTIMFLLALVLFAMGLLIVLNMTPLFVKEDREKFISRGDIRGMAVKHNDQLYTLNFEQQNQVVTLLNQAIKIGLEGFLKTDEIDFPYESLTIYRFNDQEITIKPIGLVNKQLLFQAKTFHPNGFLREIGPGQLNQLLLQTYDTPQSSIPKQRQDLVFGKEKGPGIQRS